MGKIFPSLDFFFFFCVSRVRNSRLKGSFGLQFSNGQQEGSQMPHFSYEEAKHRRFMTEVRLLA